jgi:hypothetical protein
MRGYCLSSYNCCSLLAVLTPPLAVVCVRGCCPSSRNCHLMLTALTPACCCSRAQLLLITGCIDAPACCRSRARLPCVPPPPQPPLPCMALSRGSTRPCSPSRVPLYAPPPERAANVDTTLPNSVSNQPRSPLSRRCALQLQTIPHHTCA